MRACVSILLGVILATCLVSQVSARQLEGSVPPEQHAWGRFKIGSWKRVRTTTDTLDAKGAVVNTTTTETTTKLVDLDEDGYTLRVDVVVEVGGKRFTSEPQVVRRGYNGESDGQSVSGIKRKGVADFVLNGVKIACEIREIVVASDEGTKVNTVHYSDRLSPHILRREVKTLDPTGKPLDAQTEVEVISVDKPHQVLKETKPASDVRIVHHRGKALTETLEVQCAEVPGAVVEHTSSETDESGRIVRKSVLKLVDYGLGTGEDADALTVRKAFHRLRGNRLLR